MVPPSARTTLNQSTKKRSTTTRAERGAETAPQKTDVDPTNEPTPTIKGFRVFTIAAVSLALLWLSFPPVGWWWLAWVALAPLIWLVQIDELPAARPYRQLYLVGLIYWLVTFYFIPIPHPALWFGWIAVSAYMAVYTPMFVGMSRALIHRFRIPTIIAVPIVGTGIEWIRCNFATGMAMVCLSHSQYEQPMIIQVADLCGAYTLTFVILLFSAGISLISLPFFHGIPSLNSARCNWITSGVSLALAASVVTAVLLYGNYRLGEPIPLRNDSTLKVGLIQTSEDVIFGPISDEEHVRQIENRHQLTWEARRQWDDLDVVVWPESGFNPYTDLLSDASEQVTVAAVVNVRTQAWSDATGFPNFFANPVPLLTGGGTADPRQDKYYGSAFLIGNNGQIVKRYFKNHLVMFGEYVPFAQWFPIINRISPIPGIAAGDEFTIMELKGIKLAPSICFETTIPHFIRRQVNTLAASGAEPDVMVNLTNDGWFYGTSCLDLHLACNVFRAVEMRKPHLVCANTGFSADIDSCGRLIQTGPRRKPAALRAEVQPIRRSSLYRQIGDIVPILFALISLLAGLIGWWKK
jgi:apolipoprotein N-acyltransferase